MLLYQIPVGGEALVKAGSVSWVGISSRSHIVLTYSEQDHLLCSYSLNGRLLGRVHSVERIYGFCISEDGKVLITGGERCLLVFRWTDSLELANTGSRRSLDAVIDGRTMGNTSFSFSSSSSSFSSSSTSSFSSPSQAADLDAIQSPIRSLSFSRDEQHLLVGLESGEIRVLAQVQFGSTGRWVG